MATISHQVIPSRCARQVRHNKTRKVQAGKGGRWYSAHWQRQWPHRDMDASNPPCVLGLHPETWIMHPYALYLSSIPSISAKQPPMHINQIGPRLFNPTSSELAGALTSPPSIHQATQEAFISTPAPADDIATSSTMVRSSGQSCYCSIKGCRNVIGWRVSYQKVRSLPQPRNDEAFQTQTWT